MEEQQTELKNKIIEAYEEHCEMLGLFLGAYDLEDIRGAITGTVEINRMPRPLQRFSYEMSERMVWLSVLYHCVFVAICEEK